MKKPKFGSSKRAAPKERGFSRVLRSSIKRAFSSVERLAHKYGYGLSWAPPLFFQNSEAKLNLDVEFAIAHLMLRKQAIFFVQIGANDGVSADPLYKFITEFGWNGVLVEPQPHIFEQLKKNYKNWAHNLRFINAAVSQEDGFRTLYTARVSPGTYHHSDFFSSFDRSVIARQTQWIPDIAERIEEITVPCISMNTLLSHAEDREIDILQMDTEGFDFQILKMIDFTRTRPAIICYEHANLSKADMQAAAELLFRRGYRMARDNLDTVAYRQTFTYGWRSNLSPGNAN